MFLAIFSTILQSISEIFRKKSLGYGVGGNLHELITYPFGIIILIYFFFNGLTISSINFHVFIPTFFILLLSMVRIKLYQKIFRSEKISLILPYTNVSKTLAIVLSFIIFSDVSIISFLITLIAILVVIVFSIDFKTFKFPKNIILILIEEFINGILIFWSGWVILNYGSKLYFISYLFFGILFLSILIYKNNELKTLKGVNKGFYINRTIGGLSWFSWFLSLVVISSLGLSIGILLSFFGIGITLFLSYIILKDKPTKKDLLLTLLVSLLVGIGFYFK